MSYESRCVNVLKDFLRSAGFLEGDPRNGDKSMKLWTSAIRRAQRLVKEGHAQFSKSDGPEA